MKDRTPVYQPLAIRPIESNTDKAHAQPQTQSNDSVVARQLKYYLR